jgi:enoyl-CoA hydratase/carnithine racemase
MGACALLPRVIGQGRAAELLYTGRSMSAARRASAGASSTACARRDLLLAEAQGFARSLADGPTFATA